VMPPLRSVITSAENSNDNKNKLIFKYLKDFSNLLTHNTQWRFFMV